MRTEMTSITAVVLAGGLGTRLRGAIKDLPKALSPLGDKVIIDLILEHVFLSGIKNVVLCTGHLSDKVRSYIENYDIPKGVSIILSEENTPLGTGGAVIKSMDFIKNKTILVINGDTYFPIDYKVFLEKHLKHKSQISIALHYTDKTNEFGSVVIDEGSKVISFKEKDTNIKAGLISGGAYFIEKNTLKEACMPKVFSIEKDFFEKFVNRLRVYGFPFKDYFIDIGTPKSYAKAQKELGNRKR